MCFGNRRQQAFLNRHLQVTPLPRFSAYSDAQKLLDDILLLIHRQLWANRKRNDPIGNSLRHRESDPCTLGREGRLTM